MSDDLREHADSVEDGSEDGGDLLYEGVAGKQESVLLGPLLDEFLVLVEGLQEIEVDGIDVDLLVLHDVEVLGVSDQADLKAGSGDVGQADGAGETLVLLGVVVLEADLKLH